MWNRDWKLVEVARARGFDVMCADVRDGVPGVENIDGVFAAHLIEHLAPDDLAELLRARARPVRPGGRMVLVTPNFRDWRVAREWFWLDPTHVRPYPSGAVSQLLDPDLWTLVRGGNGPRPLTRRTLVDLGGKVLHGRDFGVSEKWYELQRGHA